MQDHVDAIVEQWSRERPDVDVSPMEVVGRLSRAAQQIDRGLEKNFAGHGLDRASFDVLATLRRAGKPFALSPKDLAASSMITSSAVAQRLNKLEDRGLIVRSKSGADGRGTVVALTNEGRNMIDVALPAHVDTEHQLLAGLSPEERGHLAALLKKLGRHLEGPPQSAE